MINNRYILLCFLVLALSYQVAFAEETSSKIISEDDYIGDVPTVLTVSRLTQSMVDAPSAVTVIDRETIRASGIVDLPEIFRLVPGFYVGTNAGFFQNTNDAVSYHGMTTAYPGAMQVLINGRSVYSPLYGGVQWSELPVAIGDIDRIEITRGPNAASYGANSFFGAINIITQNPFDQSGTSVSATYGNGRHEAFAGYAAKQTDLSYRVTVGYRDDDGLDNRYDFKRTRLLNAQAGYHLSDKNSLEFELGIVDGEREEGNLKKDPYVFLPRTKDITNHYELIRWRHNLSENGDFSLQAYHSLDRSEDTAISATLKQPSSSLPQLVNTNIIIQNNVEIERFDIEAQHNFSISPSLRGIWGASIRQDDMYAPFFLGSNETGSFDLQRLFGHAEWRPFEQVVLNLGAMVEHNTFTGTSTSPRTSINFKINPSQTIRFGVSSALRTPNYFEEKFNTGIVLPTTVPNVSYLFQYYADQGNLKPERIISKEIGYLGDFGALSLDARMFHDDVHDYIRDKLRTGYTPPSGFILIGKPDGSLKVPKSFENAGDVAVKGFEAQAKWHINNDTRLLLNYAYVKIDADEKQTATNITMSMPRDTISALLTHRFNSQWDVSLAYYQTSEVAALGDGNLVGLARRADVRLARKFSLEHVHGEVSAVVENLFNEHYQEFADYNTLKRRARINVKLDF